MNAHNHFPDKILTIVIFDPSVGTTNTGDEIIMESVDFELRNIFPRAYFIRIATHEYFSRATHKLLRNCDYVFVGGTNLLTSHMLLYRQWKVGVRNLTHLKNSILFGVGWWQYQSKADIFTKFLLNHFMSKDFFHSVRDSYTQHKLTQAGFTNTLNTGCPTLWRLTNDILDAIPAARSGQVVMTVTDYYRAKKEDQELLDLLKSRYEKIYLWLQGSQDYQYAKSIFGSTVEYVDPNLAAYDELLESSIDLDYVGTRLHAGIRAMYKKRRSTIIAVDNRAAEMKKDFGLNVINRYNQAQELDPALGVERFDLRLPRDAIEKWRTQFA